MKRYHSHLDWEPRNLQHLWYSRWLYSGMTGNHSVFCSEDAHDYEASDSPRLSRPMTWGASPASHTTGGTPLFYVSIFNLGRLLVRERVYQFILWVSIVRLDPLPLHGGHFLGKRVHLNPKVFILYGRASSGTPPIPLPILNPRGDTILDICAVCKQLYLKNVACEALLKCLNDGGHFHNVVCCSILPPWHINASTKYSPTTRTWITEATSICVHVMHLYI